MKKIEQQPPFCFKIILIVFLSSTFRHFIECSSEFQNKLFFFFKYLHVSTISAQLISYSLCLKCSFFNSIPWTLLFSSSTILVTVPNKNIYKIWIFFYYSITYYYRVWIDKSWKSCSCYHIISNFNCPKINIIKKIYMYIKSKITKNKSKTNYSSLPFNAIGCHANQILNACSWFCHQAQQSFTGSFEKSLHAILRSTCTSNYLFKFNNAILNSALKNSHVVTWKT